MSTLVASYMARARGTNEPETSLQRVQQIEHLLREAHAFKTDHGHRVGHEVDAALGAFRRELEAILGNPEMTGRTGRKQDQEQLQGSMTGNITTGAGHPAHSASSPHSMYKAGLPV